MDRSRSLTGGRREAPPERIVASSQNTPNLPAVLCRGPPGTRTQNLRIKSPLLYPIELEARSGRLYQTCSRGLKRVTEGT
jgi:hypothetical protein